MKLGQSTLGRLVQRIAGHRGARKLQPSQQPVEVNAQALRQVTGGTDTAQLPTKGW